MKKFFSLLLLFTLFSVFLQNEKTLAQDSCSAKVVVHYHRYNENYEDFELYTWGYDATGAGSNLAISSTDDFGGVFEISICDDANEEIGIILKEKGTWNKDGVDANNDNNIDDKFVNVTDLRGTSNTMHVYVMQGASDVYYQNPLKPTYFGKPGVGNVVIIYYNPGGNEGWDDFWTWGTGDKNDDIIFEYNLGLDGGTDPNLFKVGIINIASGADDQIGFVARKDRSWDVKDNEWAKDLTVEETDELGHTYKPTGDRFINVTDVKGSGYKFIFIINGVKTFYEDFDAFKAEAFKLEFTEAQFRSTKALSISFNQAINYGPTGPETTSFEIIDQDGNVIPIERITFNSLKTSDKTFNIILQNDIVQGSNYTVIYNFEQFAEEKTTQAQTTIAEGVFTEDPDDEPEVTNNYTPYIIAGITLVGALAVGVALILGRKK